jgi:hypothetical protein
MANAKPNRARGVSVIDDARAAAAYLIRANPNIAPVAQLTRILEIVVSIYGTGVAGRSDPPWHPDYMPPDRFTRGLSDCDLGFLTGIWGFYDNET